MADPTEDFVPFGMMGWSAPADALDTTGGVAPIRWNVPLMYAAINACVLYEGSRFELVGGQLIQAAERPSPRFYHTIRVAADSIENALGRSCRRGVLHISDDTELEPELLVTGPPRDSFRKTHPTPKDALLVGEVAEGARGFLLGRKALIYSRSGIAEYWVLDYTYRMVIVHRDPTEGGYRTVAPYEVGMSITPLSSPHVKISVCDLLDYRSSNEPNAALRPAI